MKYSSTHLLSQVQFVVEGLSVHKMNYKEHSVLYSCLWWNQLIRKLSFCQYAFISPLVPENNFFMLITVWLRLYNCFFQHIHLSVAIKSFAYVTNVIYFMMQIWLHIVSV